MTSTENDMSHRNFTRVTLLALFVVIESSAAHAHDPASTEPTTARHADEAPFLAENAAAMDKMMAAMEVTPTGDVATDFAAMMIPHHQGAIDMAIAYLRHGKNEQLRRIAQEIIVEQQQEIAAMRLALGQPLPPSAPAPTQVLLPDHSSSSHKHVHDHATTGAGSMPMPAASETKSNQEGEVR
jgi:uncharacterized protein (DUF305 family)